MAPLFSKKMLLARWDEARSSRAIPRKIKPNGVIVLHITF